MHSSSHPANSPVHRVSSEVSREISTKCIAVNEDNKHDSRAPTVAAQDIEGLPVHVIKLASSVSAVNKGYTVANGNTKHVTKDPTVRSKGSTVSTEDTKYTSRVLSERSKGLKAPAGKSKYASM